MSILGSDYHPLDGLSEEEIEIERLLRGIDNTIPNWQNQLWNTMAEELINPAARPEKTHATDLKEEMNLCVAQSKYISALLNKRTITEFKVLSNLFAKVMHWRERTFRLKGRFHQDTEVDQLINFWRRVKKLVEIDMEEAHKSEAEAITNIPTEQDNLNKLEVSLNNMLLDENKSIDLVPTTVAQLVSSTEAKQSGTLPITPSKSEMNISMPGPSIVTGPGNTNSIFTTTDTIRFNSIVNSLKHTLPPNVSIRNIAPPSTSTYFSSQLPILTSNDFNYRVPPPPVNNVTWAMNPSSIPAVGTNYFNTHRQPSQSHVSYPIPQYHPTRLDPKWNISFTGMSNSLDINDFIFRIETFARREHIDENALDAILPKFLQDHADKWYWVFIRSYPNASYRQLKAALIQRFSSTESERATRRLIENKRQRYREPIGEYILEMQSLNNRLINPYSEQDLLEILRENIVADLQNAILTTHLFSIEDLRLICQKFERLWAQASKHSNIDRQSRSINEIVEAPVEMLTPMIHTAINRDTNVIDDNEFCNNYQVDEISKTPVPRRIPSANQYNSKFLICWNCRDIGHRYQDCHKVPQGFFCYGCGEPNVIKPQCLKCIKNNQGNTSTSVNRSGLTHSTTSLTRQQSVVKIRPPETETAATNTEPAMHR